MLDDVKRHHRNTPSSLETHFNLFHDLIEEILHLTPHRFGDMSDCKERCNSDFSQGSMYQKMEKMYHTTVHSASGAAPINEP